MVAGKYIFIIQILGIFNDENGEKLPVVWGFNRKDMSNPAFMLPTFNKASVCARFCPILFKKDKNVNNINNAPELLDLEYKMVFAVGTIDSIIIYHTQSIIPISIITNIHCQPLTDLAWNGGSILAASSSDGYITFVVFEKDELGEILNPDQVSNELTKSLYQSYLNIDINSTIQKVNNLQIMKVNIRRKEDVNNNNTILKEKEYEEDKNKMQVESNIEHTNTKYIF